MQLIHITKIFILINKCLYSNLQLTIVLHKYDCDMSECHDVAKPIRHTLFLTAQQWFLTFGWEEGAVEQQLVRTLRGTVHKL